MRVEEILLPSVFKACVEFFFSTTEKAKFPILTLQGKGSGTEKFCTATSTLLELSPMDTYVHTLSLKFPLGRVPQQVGSTYLFTWGYQY
jgi:hypothetical protein